MRSRLTNHARRTTRARRCRRGFSLIELMTVVSVLGLLVAIAIPRYRDTKRRAFAAKIAADFNTVRVAAYNYFADNNTYPPDGSPGVPPAALVPYLPQNFQFDAGNYTLDYDVWPSPANPKQLVVAVTVTSGDQQLVNMVARNSPAGGTGINVGNGYTYIFAGL
ncbi:MAG TPA: prepilin-type N-terminal cleavage/methylation domain-containing protein [Gemmatimonadaceae bacterium]|jgi:prepilin-type N-terminal cleavage/methylation domain-containing protein|nr:prepilin-type N-terminal cleavage/methylation domain-containing protein [Gemmatimonadaceae bacterium]